MNLETKGLFKTLDVQQELATNEHSIRREIFETVIAHIVPKILEDSHEEYQLPGDVHSSSHLDLNSSYEVQRDIGATNSEIKIVMRVKADRNLSGAQAMFAERAAIADSTANIVIHNLKAACFGVTHSRNANNWELNGRKTKRYEPERRSA